MFKAFTLKAWKKLSLIFYVGTFEENAKNK